MPACSSPSLEAGKPARETALDRETKARVRNGGCTLDFVDQHEPVKERPDPVPCTECGRVNWSNLALCVYCRLGWPDPGDMRGLPPDREGVGHLRLDPPVGSTQSAERQVDWTSDGQALRRVLLDNAGRICEDVACIRCKYNLRSLRHGDACPECSESVERSLMVSEMAAADPRWLNALSSGAWFLFWGLTLVGLTPVFLFLTGFLAFVTLTIGLILAMIGVFRLTTAQGGYSPSYEVADINEKVRLAASYTAIAIPLVFIFPYVLSRSSPVALVLSVTFLLAMVGVCGAATMMLLGTYAEKLNCKTHAFTCRVIAALFATIIGVTLLTGLLSIFAQQSFWQITCFAVLLLPLGLWTVVIVILVARELDAVLKIASNRTTEPQ